jgi:hypothetical protein
MKKGTLTTSSTRTTAAPTMTASSTRTTATPSGAFLDDAALSAG